MTTRLDTETAEKVRKAFKNALSCGDAFTSGGQSLARVILSAYNIYEWTFNIGDLCVLDTKNFTLAIAVITARYKGIEPHNAYEGAEQDMESLKTKYSHLMKKDH